ncbi:MAG: DUF3443 family protein [Candidatus Competibacteraceae bacterium]|nr:MAG: DUF3443 family protein [Candidatus Competibacteraceae bacterium]
MSHPLPPRDPTGLRMKSIAAAALNRMTVFLTKLAGILLIVGGASLTIACSDHISDHSGTSSGIGAAFQVSCSPSSVTARQTSHCSAHARNGRDAGSTVTWSTSAGHIDSTGRFTAPSVSNPTAVTITATAQQDRAHSSAVAVRIDPIVLAYNVLPITVDGGPPGTPRTVGDGLFTSVQVCMPGSSTQCQTIDHVLIDTGSVGLRLLSAARGGELSLPLPRQATADSHSLVECFPWMDGFAWGPVAVADLYLGGETASSIPIQIIAPADAPAIPRSCSDAGHDTGDLSSLGAHGILGIGPFLQDCGETCSQQAYDLYYACPGATCVATAVSTAQQLQNPVALFANDNNGVIVDLPAMPDAGPATISGSLIFGIGTQDNNTLSDAPVVYLGGSLAGGGIPFFSGRTLYVAIEHQSTPAGKGPYWAMH